MSKSTEPLKISLRLCLPPSPTKISLVANLVRAGKYVPAHTGPEERPSEVFCTLLDSHKLGSETGEAGHKDTLLFQVLLTPVTYRENLGPLEVLNFFKMAVLYLCNCHHNLPAASAQKKKFKHLCFPLSVFKSSTQLLC